MNVLVCSVNQEYSPGDSMSRVRDILTGNWRISQDKARTAELVAAWFKARPIGAFMLRDAFVSDEPWDKRVDSRRSSRRRSGLILGEPAPLPLELLDLQPALRNGVCMVCI